MGTIVQEYGPIYGEVVNGTVQGRPNGSVYVPESNIMEQSLIENQRYITPVTVGGQVRWRICNSSGVASNQGPNNLNLNAKSQDLSSYMRTTIYEDSDLTTPISIKNRTAGVFADWVRDFYKLDPDYVLVDGTSYYFLSELINNGTAVATSSVIEIVAVVP